MPLNQVQQDFINNAARPHMEILVRIKHELDTFVRDYDAIQSSVDTIPVTATVLDDAGENPRADAPILYGNHIETMRNLSANMSSVIDGITEEVLISKMKRTLSSILRLG